MSENYYIADTHFGLQNCISFDARPFETIEEHDETLIANWNSVVTDKDHVYVLGDFAFKNKRPVSEYTKRLNGHLHLIRGNHDKKTAEYESCFETVDDVLTIVDVLDDIKRRVVLCHYWMPFVGQRKIMLYGHTHTGDEYILENLLKDELKRNDYPMNSYNVGCMHIGYFPRTLDQIVSGQIAARKVEGLLWLIIGIALLGVCHLILQLFMLGLMALGLKADVRTYYRKAHQRDVDASEGGTNAEKDYHWLEYLIRTIVHLIVFVFTLGLIVIL